MVTRHAVNSGKSASPVRHHEIANPLETEIEPDDLALGDPFRHVACPRGKGVGATRQTCQTGACAA
jgi:hypothetical protein